MGTAARVVIAGSNLAWSEKWEAVALSVRPGTAECRTELGLSHTPGMAWGNSARSSPRC